MKLALKHSLQSSVSKVYCGTQQYSSVYAISFSA